MVNRVSVKYKQCPRKACDNLPNAWFWPLVLSDVARKPGPRMTESSMERKLLTEGAALGGRRELLLTLQPLQGCFRFEGVDSQDLGWKRTVCRVFRAQEGEGRGERHFVVAEEINLCFVVLS